MRRQIAVSILAVLAAGPAAAQQRDPGGLTPKTMDAVGLQRANDQVVSRQKFEAMAAQKPLRSVRLKDAIRDLKVNDFPVAPLHVAYGEFVTADGHYFVAMHFAPPAAVSVPPDGKVTFFGEMLGDDGAPVWTREEPVTLSRTPAGGWYFDRSFPFPPGNRTGTFGLAVKDQPLAMASVPVLLVPLEKTSRRVSKLIVSNHVFPLEKTQAADDPFAFGGMKVIPNASRTFRRADELWIFYEAQNPALEASGPRFTTNVQLEPAAGGNAKRYGVVAADAMPLKGVPGHFGIGTTVDISRVVPGEYLLRVGVADAVAGSTYELVEKVVIVD